MGASWFSRGKNRSESKGRARAVSQSAWALSSSELATDIEQGIGRNGLSFWDSR
jgi:hypothetical protein